MVKTIELMLGLPAMSIFDLVATDMRNSFIAPGEAPNSATFSAIEPKQSLGDRNLHIGSIRGLDSHARRLAARESARMSFDGPDEAPAETLNRILWHDARGWKTPYPAVEHSLFFPMSADVADEEREEKAIKLPAKRAIGAKDQWAPPL